MQSSWLGMWNNRQIMTVSFRRIALIGKPNSTEIVASLAALFSFLHERGCEVVIEVETARAMGGQVAGCAIQEIGRDADLAVVLGGDGTMLSAARHLARQHVPLTGVNQGRIGFMTDIGLDGMCVSLGRILDGEYSIEDRSLIDAEIVRSGQSVLRTVALNEAVIGKGAQGRLIEFDLIIDGEYVYTLRADGIIVATPTGSTAYALSAQGPILHPTLPAFAVVPLNPHILSTRPVSVSDRSVIEVRLLKASDARVHFDGFALADLEEGDRLLLRRSVDAIRFVHPPGYNYFSMLRRKLGWSERVYRTSQADDHA